MDVFGSRDNNNNNNNKEVTCFLGPPNSLERKGRTFSSLKRNCSDGLVAHKLSMAQERWWNGSWLMKMGSIESTPRPRMRVTTGSIIFFVGNPNKPSFTTVKGVDPRNLWFFQIFSSCSFWVWGCLFLVQWKMTSNGTRWTSLAGSYFQGWSSWEEK